MLLPFRHFRFFGASQPPSAGGGGGGGGSLPAGATWHLDFVNAFNWAGGAERAIGDILGGAFNPTYLTGAGLDTSFDNDNRPDAIGALLTDMASLMTSGTSVVVEIDGILEGGEMISFFNAAGDPNDATAYADCFAQFQLAVEDFDQVFNQVDYTSAKTTGIHRVGVTWYLDIGGGDFESAVCVNGEAPVTDTTAYGGAAFTVLRAGVGHAYDLAPYFWGADNSGFVFRSITGYPAMDTTSLQALTVVP